MRILVISREAPPVGGGAGYVAVRLAEHLAERDHEIDFVTMHFKGLVSSERRSRQLSIHRLRCGRRRQESADFPSMATFASRAIGVGRKLTDERRFDLVHAHGIVPDGIAAWRLKKAFGTPLVITAHGSDVPGYNDQQFRKAHVLVRPLWRRIVQDADLIITPSNYLGNLITKQIAQVRTQTIHNGIDIDLFPEDFSVSKRSAFLIVARLVPRKNFHLFFEAARHVESSQEIHVVGDGPEADRLRSLAQSMPQHQVHFHGWLQHGSESWSRLYRECRFFVFPSANENFPINLLEAQLGGMTVLASSAPGCREVLGDDAIYFPETSVDGIRSVLTWVLDAEPKALEVIGHRARQRVQKRFSWGRVAYEYAETLESLLAPPGHD